MPGRPEEEKENLATCRFGPFTVNEAEHHLSYRGVLVPLQRRAFDILALLISDPGHLFTRYEIMEKVWAGSVVQEQNLTAQMHALRKALDDQGPEPIYIQTVRGVGYRFIAALETDDLAVTRTPPPPTKHRRWLHGSLLGLVGVTAVLAYLLPFQSDRAPAANAQTAPRSIAVLPFEPLTTDKSEPNLARAISDEIGTRLARIRDLQVVTPSSSMTRPGHTLDPVANGRDLGVASVLTGTVQVTNGIAHVNLRLINTDSGVALWAAGYTQSSADILQLEGDVADAVASALHAKLTGNAKGSSGRRPTTNISAYNAYLRGLAYGNRASYSRAMYATAADYFAQACKLDPEFALAWAHLSRAHIDFYVLGYDHTAARLALARQAADKALQLAPDEGQTWLAEGEYRLIGKNDPPGALRAFNKANMLLPNSADVLSEMSYAERALGHWRKALSYGRQAARIDPRSPRLLYQWAITHIALREFGEARSVLNRALNISPDDPELIARLAATYQAEGRLAAAERILGKLPLHPENSRIFGVQIGQMLYQHRYTAAIAALRTAISHWTPDDGNAVGYYYVLLGRALDLSGKADEAANQWQAGYENLSHLQAKGDDSLAIAANLSLLDAYLGRAKEARARIDKAIAVAGTDRIEGPRMLETLARIQVRLGQPDAALGIVSRLLKVPYGNDLDVLPLTRAMLAQDPAWRPLQDRSGYQQLVHARPDQQDAASTEAERSL